MAFKVTDMRTPTNVNTTLSESYTFTAGAAGTKVIFRIKNRPILNSGGTALGNYQDTSFVWTTGTVFTTEVSFDKSQVNYEEYLDTLSNGEYAIDYSNGVFIGKKATTGTSDTCTYTSENVNSLGYGQYLSSEPTLTNGDYAPLLFNEKGHLKVDTEMTLHSDNLSINNIKNYSTDGTSANVVYGKADSDGTVNINTTKIKGTATDVNSGNKSDGSQRVVIATDDIPIALINTNLGDIETDIEATNTALGTVNTNLGTIETDIEATNTALGTVNTNLGTVNTNLGTIETDIEATNTALGTVNTNLGTIETDIEATNTALGTVNTNLGDIETDIEATNTALGTVNTNLGDIETDIEATNTLLGDGNQKTQIVDGSGNVIGATSNALDINVKSGSVTVTATDLDIRNLTATDVVTTQGQVKLGGKFITPTCPITVPASYVDEAISQFAHAGKVTTTTANKVYDLGIPAGILDGTNLGMMYELVISMNDYADATGTDASTIIKIYRENTADGNDPTTTAIDEEVFIASSVVVIPLVHSWATTKIVMTSSTGSKTFNYRVRGAYYTPA